MASAELTALAKKLVESPSFKTRFIDAQVNAGKRRLAFATDELESSKVSKLLLQGSLLALSDELDHRGLSQKINAILYETKLRNELINTAIQVISSRLGNFPVIGIDSKIFGENSLMKGLSEGLEVLGLLDPEVVGNLFDEEEAAHVNIAAKTFYFNIYQREILDSLSSKSLISFSAPTSFGKSFVVRHHIARQFATGDLKRALIIVPTKSLIDDFFEEMTELKAELELDFLIFTHARLAEEAPEKSIFILTQERLSFLIEKNPEFIKTLEIVYCDEAQNISRGYRGFVLRAVLRKLINLCGVKGFGGRAQYIFSSPLIKNPQYYRDRFFSSLDEDVCFHKEVLYSPVEKNIHFVLKRKNEFSFFLYHETLEGRGFGDKLQEIGGYDFPDSLRNDETYRENELARDVNIILKSNLAGRTILYATSPLSAHEYAIELASKLAIKETIPDSDLTDISRYIRDHFDESFGLIDLIKKGIGLHYGKMPIGLRRAMVGLFEKGYIDYMVCTSTLLEGVNLPARNIFIFSNKHHNRKKHSSLSFGNLIGRAGRLTYGLSGNIFCIAEKSKEYEELFSKSDAEIKDPELDVSENETKLNHVITSFLDKDKTFEYLNSPYRDDIEYLIYELITFESMDDVLNRFNLLPEVREAFIAAVTQCRDSLDIPLEFLKKNPGIDPRLQKELLVSLRLLEKEDLLDLLEITSNPFSLNAAVMGKILDRTSRVLRWPKINPNFDVSEVTAKRITQWLHEKSITDFIQQALFHHQNSPQLEKIEKALKVIDKLDTDVSYKAPKYIKCFYDFVLYVAMEKGLPSDALYLERVESFLFAIESGVSSSIGRYLYERGLSRPIAIKVNSLLGGSTFIGGLVVEYLKSQEILDRLRLGLSKIAFQELLDHL